jgi:citrate lyase subunit beta/citryl-CoA lyase
MELGPIRTALFVPGDNPRRMDKALTSEADAVIVDLEDAVSPGRKPEARRHAKGRLTVRPGKAVVLRVNAHPPEVLWDDLSVLSPNGPDAIMLPKVEDAAAIERIDASLSERERDCGRKEGTTALILLIETARGIRDLEAILRANLKFPRIYTAAFGAADYALDLGVELTFDGNELLYPRSLICVACRAAGLAPPLDTPFMIDLHSEDALINDARRSKQLGFQGKLCIHPGQIEPCHRVFSPSAKDISSCEQIVRAFQDAETRGIGALQHEGQFIDYPRYERARRIIQFNERVKAKTATNQTRI